MDGGMIVRWDYGLILKEDDGIRQARKRLLESTTMTDSMIDNMIERCARAMIEAEPRDDPGFRISGCSDLSDNEWRDLARAAIEAMREPTRVMEIAGIEQSHDDTPRDVTNTWRAMLDAALADNQHNRL
jgi:hypothetical protein